jgi:hypothetical protein
MRPIRAAQLHRNGANGLAIDLEANVFYATREEVGFPGGRVQKFRCQ